MKDDQRTFLWVIFFTKKENENLSTEVKKTGKKRTEASKNIILIFDQEMQKGKGKGKGKGKIKEIYLAERKDCHYAEMYKFARRICQETTNPRLL